MWVDEVLRSWWYRGRIISSFSSLLPPLLPFFVSSSSSFLFFLWWWRWWWCLSIYPHKPIHPSPHLPTYRYISCLSFWLSMYLPAYLSVWLLINLFPLTYPNPHLYVCLWGGSGVSVCQSVYLYLCTNLPTYLLNDVCLHVWLPIYSLIYKPTNLYISVQFKSIDSPCYWY